MEPTHDQLDSSKVFNLPNLITLTRLALAIVIFVLIPLDRPGMYYAAFWIFLIAASTDWIDGYLARRNNQVTQLGRILDPFCDKIIICGTYILIAIATAMSTDQPWYLITGWMAVVVVGRELLVTVLRGFIEQHGGDFSANMAGKLKMVFQCVAVSMCLYVFATGSDDVAPVLQWTTGAFVWISVVSTIYSGTVYVFAAIRMVRNLPATAG
ncbi:MAG: CDP-diacylglycerol--glycerol-3-phosphate 3-phosphatidyltransferase [Planctomycetota bacterium]|nr:CDP-diacylglycerol--glycerol-3-phosphate 3-phosphatidyltransferase [Planctomycetota bacterium]